jgi:hypothetical protein
MVGTWRRDRSSDEMCHSGFRWSKLLSARKGNEMTRKRPTRGPYGPKINRNLIKCHLQVFCDNPGGFQKIGPGAENRVQ